MSDDVKKPESHEMRMERIRTELRFEKMMEKFKITSKMLKEVPKGEEENVLIVDFKGRRVVGRY
jgi:hypothetical protein